MNHSDKPDKVEHYPHPDWGEEVKKTWSCKAIIIKRVVDKIEILLTPNEHDGHMSIPWGTVKIDEEPEETLTRECREELECPQFQLSNITHLKETEVIFRWPKDDKYRHKVYMWFACSITDGIETGKGQFIELEEALKVLKDFEKEAIQHYIASQTN